LWFLAIKVEAKDLQTRETRLIANPSDNRALRPTCRAPVCGYHNQNWRARRAGGVEAGLIKSLHWASQKWCACCTSSNKREALQKLALGKHRDLPLSTDTQSICLGYEHAHKMVTKLPH
jgi:hypothetical protein